MLKQGRWKLVRELIHFFLLLNEMTKFTEGVLLNEMTKFTEGAST